MNTQAVPGVNTQTGFFEIDGSQKAQYGQPMRNWLHSEKDENSQRLYGQWKKTLYFQAQQSHVPKTPLFELQLLVEPLDQEHKKVLARNQAYFTIEVTVKDERDEILIRIDQIFLSELAGKYAYHSQHREKFSEIRDEMEQNVKQELTKFLIKQNSDISFESFPSK